MKKRLLAFVMLLTLLVPGTVLQAETLTGTASGYGGDVTVTLEVSDGVLVDVKAEGTGETPGIG